MKIMVESIELQGDFCCEAVIRYGDIGLEINFAENELLLPEFVRVPFELREKIKEKIMFAMCMERRKTEAA